jgi:hypothetical protein
MPPRLITTRGLLDTLLPASSEPSTSLAVMGTVPQVPQRKRSEFGSELNHCVKQWLRKVHALQGVVSAAMLTHPCRDGRQPRHRAV